MIIGCDGIFDRLDNCDVLQSIWSMCNENLLGKDVNEHCGKISDIIIRNCLASGANDNLTCIFVCFENFKNLLFNSDNNLNKINVNIERILSNLRNISNESFSELISENNNILEEKEKPQRKNTTSSNNAMNNGNNPSEKQTPSKSENKIISSNSIPNSKEQKKDKRFHMTLNQHNNFEPNSTKLISPGKPKVL